ncbi:unnamed protein product, partial [Ectocarpus sp. 12 AP-2014]
PNAPNLPKKEEDPRRACGSGQVLARNRGECMEHGVSQGAVYPKHPRGKGVRHGDAWRVRHTSVYQLYTESSSGFVCVSLAFRGPRG